MPQFWTATQKQRLDAFLVERCPEMTRSRIQKCIQAGVVEVNSTSVSKPSFLIKDGDLVSLQDDHQSSPISEDIPLVDLSFEVLYEDDDCLVIHKPAGIAMHPGSGMQAHETTVLHGVAFHFHNAGIPFEKSAVLVHRLDKDTTGCLLLAKSPSAHAALQKQFADRDVHKQYLAITAGIVDPPVAQIDAPIGRNVNDRTRMSVTTHSMARPAKTSYESLDTSDNATLLLCTLHTGRTHQVRVHLSSIGYPLLGDSTYATPDVEVLSKNLDISSLCLHAWKLRFSSPVTGKEIAVTCDPPSAFCRSLEASGLSLPI